VEGKIHGAGYHDLSTAISGYGRLILVGGGRGEDPWDLLP
jgi:hypothetical protein